MSNEYEDRIEEGKVLLSEQLKKIEAQTNLYLAALKGFRRDLALSASAMSYIDAEFTGLVTMITVPPLSGGRSFADLSEMLRLCEDAENGSMYITTPPVGPDQSRRERLLAEIDITHKNLAEVSDTAHRLYETIRLACFEFDVFNTKNIEVRFTEANIIFDRDALYAATSAARALGERAVRLDIDLVEARRRVETGQRQTQ